MLFEFKGIEILHIKNNNKTIVFKSHGQLWNNFR